MDNQDKIKYKQSAGSFVKKIDIATSSVMAEFNIDQPKRYAGLIAEMQAWVDAGNEIEPQFTEAELEEKATKEAEDAKTAYIGLRQSEYPSIGDQLDYIYHNGIEAWKTEIIKPIKDKYPKSV
jgi:hypothetical protein